MQRFIFPLMKRMLAFLFFVLLCSYVQAQDAFLKGKMYDCKFHSAIADVELIVSESGKELYRCFTNEYGTYVICGNVGKTYSVSISIGKKTASACSMIFSYFNAVEEFKWSPKVAGISQQDICFTPKDADVIFPLIHYNANRALMSDEKERVFWQKPKFEKLACLMRDKPWLIIEISAHASSSEKSPDSLAAARAEIILSEFLHHPDDYGRISSDRFRIKNYGASQPAETKDGIKLSADFLSRLSGKTRDSLDALNRRCTFKIAGWDYPFEKNKTYRYRFEDTDSSVFMYGKTMDPVWGLNLADVHVVIESENSEPYTVTTSDSGFYCCWLDKGVSCKLGTRKLPGGESDTSRSWKSKYIYINGWKPIQPDADQNGMYHHDILMTCAPGRSWVLPVATFVFNSSEESPVAPQNGLEAIGNTVENCIRHRTYIYHRHDSISSVQFKLTAYIDTSETNATKLAEKRLRKARHIMRRLYKVRKKYILTATESESSRDVLIYYYKYYHPIDQPRLSPAEEVELLRKWKSRITCTPVVTMHKEAIRK